MSTYQHPSTFLHHHHPPLSSQSELAGIAGGGVSLWKPSPIPQPQKFGRAFQLPPHSEPLMSQALKPGGPPLLAELRFLKAAGPSLPTQMINSMSNIPLAPLYYDPQMSQYLSRQ
jgi:hypothetical protein